MIDKNGPRSHCRYGSASPAGLSSLGCLLNKYRYIQRDTRAYTGIGESGKSGTPTGGAVPPPLVKTQIWQANRRRRIYRTDLPKRRQMWLQTKMPPLTQDEELQLKANQQQTVPKGNLGERVQLNQLLAPSRRERLSYPLFRRRLWLNFSNRSSPIEMATVSTIEKIPTFGSPSFYLRNLF